MKYSIQRFSHTITKPYQDVKKFEVARFEYGDDGNWVNAIILNLTVEKDGRLLKMDCAIADGQIFVAYSNIYNGKAEIEKVQEK